MRTETGHKIITPEHHPKNILVVAAQNMAEAIAQADHGLRQDGIQGVVWYRTPNHDANEIAFKLYKAFQERVGFPSDPEKFFDGFQRSARLTDHKKLLWTYDAPWGSEPDTCTFSLEDVFTNSARDEILDFTATFNSLNAYLFFLVENSNTINTHIDGAIDTAGYQKRRDSLLFRGFDTAAVMAYTVAGTLVAETDSYGAPFINTNRLKSFHPEFKRFNINDSLAPDLWALGLNSWLFFHPEWTEFGTAKALIHSFPEFDILPREISPSNPPRLFMRVNF